MANFCVRYGNLVFVMANSKNVVFFMVKNRCVRYGCVRYDCTPIFIKNSLRSWIFWYTMHVLNSIVCIVGIVMQ